jgi:hypothetical protein
MVGFEATILTERSLNFAMLMKVLKQEAFPVCGKVSFGMELADEINRFSCFLIH